MSKSKENFYTKNDLEIHNIEPLAMRYLFLQTHYRQEMNFTWESAQASQNTLENLRSFIIGLRIQLHDDPSLNDKISSQSETEQFRNNFTNAISNDLNTAEGLSVMWSMLKSKLYPVEKMNLLQEFDKVLGLKLKFGPYVAKEEIPEEIIQLAEQRKQAKLEKDYTKSDELRKQIEALGYEIKDEKEGYRIIKK